MIRTGGYHYDLPAASAEINQDLLSMVPGQRPQAGRRRLPRRRLRQGLSRQRNPICHYTGIERDPAPANAARPHCDFVFDQDIESAGPEFWSHVNGADCWILGEVLEHMNDPWAVLTKIRSNMAPGGRVVAAIPNFQHWSIQARLNAGDLRYGPGRGDEQGPQAHLHARRHA